MGNASELAEDDPTMPQRERALWDYWGKYKNVMKQTGFENTPEMQRTEEWVRQTQLTNRREVLESIVHREEFFKQQGQEIIEEGPKLHQEFMERMKESKPFIAKASYEKWMKRYFDSSVGFPAKKYWIKHQFPYYIERWKQTAEERDRLVKDSRFADLVAYEPACSLLADREKFLELHYDVRKGLVAQAHAALLAADKLQLDLYADAKKQLLVAEQKNTIGRGKTGIWLERIFKSKASPKKIEQCVRGSDITSLHGLIDNWAKVKGRYDIAAKRVSERGDEQMPRGQYLLGEQQFLSLHYTQRIRYVEQLEDRLNLGSDLSKEPDDFIRIRHAMDTKDWTEASSLIEKAGKLPLSVTNRQRLDSMRRYVTQFRPKKTEKASAEAVTAAKNKIDGLMTHVPTTMQPMLFRLLRGVNANRSIHQLRWMVYNNKWCRSHGYLDDEKATKGASHDNRELTKFRAKWGQDIGRNDVLDWDTADQQYFRKKEFANHKATFLHVNLQSGAPNALAEWLEHEQDPKVLYWTTFCGHENGMPKSENWHNDLLFILSELRSAARTLGKAGYFYDGSGSPLRSLN